MAKLNDDLQILQDTRDNIKQAIISKGQDVNNDIRTYAEAIESIKADTPELSQAITDLENQVQELTNELANKTAGSGAKLNIYTQTTEPKEKEGIWVNTNNKFDKIEFADAVVAGEEWDTEKMSGLKVIPYSFEGGRAVSSGTSIYLFGSNQFGNYNKAYKYDTLTDTYTQLTDVPFNFGDGCATIIGDTVYLFGSRYASTNKEAYKYDTLTDTYTQLTDVPGYGAIECSAIANGTDIYIFRFADSSETRRGAAKYDTLTDTYTWLRSSSDTFLDGPGLAINGTDIYIFSGTTLYKYDILTDTYTQLGNIPHTHYFDGACITYGTDVYLLGGGQDYNTYLISDKFDMTTETFTSLENVPYGFTMGGSTKVNNEIYLFGGAYNLTKVQILKILSPEFEDNSLIIHNGTTYKTQLYTNDKVEGRVLNYFDNVYDYTKENGLQQTYDTYYGDGTQWVEIE